MNQYATVAAVTQSYDNNGNLIGNSRSCIDEYRLGDFGRLRNNRAGLNRTLKSRGLPRAFKNPGTAVITFSAPRGAANASAGADDLYTRDTKDSRERRNN